MNGILSEGLLIMAVGMISVFTILSLVVASGHLLIRTVNRFFPVITPAKSVAQNFVSEPLNSSSEKAKIAAITAAVEIFTQGKGRIKSIEKLK